jgi:hypothetical protein
MWLIVAECAEWLQNEFIFVKAHQGPIAFINMSLT